MLKVQEYLLSGKTFVDLEAELGIKSTFHDTLPLVILNYSQIDSPKTNNIVRECRGLVLRSDDFSLVARGFNRFYNWGEVADEMPLFNFNDFIVQSKEDGSLVLIYYFNDCWMANTRGSFAQYKMEHQDFTWEEAFCKAMKIKMLKDLSGKLNDKICYVCEFCSPYNKIVRRYPEPVMFLLSAFFGNEELNYKDVDNLVLDVFLRPQRYEFNSIQAIQDFLQSQISADPTFEGVVICDKHGRRWKIKNPAYIALHHLKGEGNNIFNPKYLLPFILSGESDELLVYFPEVSESFYKCKEKVDEAYVNLEKVFKISQGIESQKDFALAIVGKTPFTGVLFSLRKKYGITQTIDQLKKEWQDNTNNILSVMFSSKV